MRFLACVIALTALSACVPAATSNAPLSKLEVPGGPTLEVAATKLANTPNDLRNAFDLFYTSKPDRLGQAIALELGDPNALETAFRRQGVTVQSRWQYVNTRLFTWPLGSTGRVVAVVQGSQALLRVHGSDLNAPFDGRVIAKRLAQSLTPKRYVDAKKLGEALEYTLTSPRVPGFEYSLRRPTLSNPNAFDEFDFRVTSLEARFVEARPTRFPSEVEDALQKQFGANRVQLLTPPARISGEPHVGLEVGVLIGNCSLEGLTETKAAYVCSREGRERNVEVGIVKP